MAVGMSMVTFLDSAYIGGCHPESFVGALLAAMVSSASPELLALF
jgi:hypothetical protein